MTDNRGGTNVGHQAGDRGAPNQAPVAAFTVTVNNLDLTVDGSSSTDPDGTVASYAWNFGDGTTGTGAKPATHTYATAGTRTVTLTVTDNAGGTNTVTQPVTATAPPVEQGAGGRRSPPRPPTWHGSRGRHARPPIRTAPSRPTRGTSGTARPAPARPPRGPTRPAGTYTVKLTVTDDKGATGRRTKTSP